jgi:hypothetical protein
MLRRHPVLSILFFLLLLGGLALLAFLFTFDLNRYRDHLQVQLSESLCRPVRLGEVSFSLRPGLSLKFSDLQIGSASDEGDFAHVDHLFLNTKFLPLLRGEIQITTVELERPRFHINSSSHANSAERELSLPAGLGFFESIHVQALHIRDGSILFRDQRHPARPFMMQLEQIDAQFSNLSPHGKGRFKLTGLLQGESRISFSGSISPHSDGWADWGIDLKLKIAELSPGPLLTRYAPSAWSATGAVSAEVTASGSAASGLDIQSVLQSTDLSFKSPTYPQGLAIRTLALNGRWMVPDDSLLISGIQVANDDISVSGNLSLTTKKARPWLEIELASTPLTLAQVTRLFPDPPPHFADLLYRSGSHGSLRVDSARFAGPPSEFSRPDGKLPLKDFLIEVQVSEFYLQQDPIRHIGFFAAYRDGLLEVTEGRAVFLDSPIGFSGEVAQPFHESREFYLEAEGVLPIRSLFDLLPDYPGRQLETAGEVAILLVVQGISEHLHVDLQCDLVDTNIDLAGITVKTRGGTGNLFLTGEITPDHLLLSHGRLSIPPMNMRLRGSWQRQGDQSFHLKIDVPDFDLKQARSNIPLLEKFHAHGQIGVHGEWTGTAGQIRKGEGIILLRDFGIRPTGVIGGITGATGRLVFHGDKIQTAEPIAARLGKSPVQVEGSLQQFDDFRIELLVSSMAIWADDLVFPSPRMILRDVEGKLTISAAGIDFHSVRVRLEGGTVAQVRGRLESFRHPRVLLDIEGDYGNVDEIINLWERPASHRPSKEPSGIDVFVLVKAHAKEGTLRQFPFQEATAEISYQGGILDIHPLQFKTGPGFCLGQVMVDASGTGPAALKISGHVEQADAAAVYNQLIHRRGLLSGTLYGDFYLEGNLGDFLATSQGGFHLEIRSGVLHKFPFLSKVFSLLNVSQILTFKLPDMSREGMPFRRLAGNISLHNGLLSTEDLFVDSPAMNLSLIGDYHIAEDRLDLLLGVKPLRTVDRIVSKIPLAGWLLTGEEKALITAHFQISGTGEDPEVVPVPITSISDKVRGIFTRLFGLPGRVWNNLEEFGRQERSEE